MVSVLEFTQRAKKLTQTKPPANRKLKKRFAKIDRKYNPHPKKWSLADYRELVSVATGQSLSYVPVSFACGYIVPLGIVTLKAAKLSDGVMTGHDACGVAE